MVGVVIDDTERQTVEVRVDAGGPLDAFEPRDVQTDDAVQTGPRQRCAEDQFRHGRQDAGIALRQGQFQVPKTLLARLAQGQERLADPQLRDQVPLRGQTLRQLKRVMIYPASHYVTPDLVRRQAMAAIEQALVLMAPPNVYYYARAGSIYEWAGDKNQALYAYRQVLLIDPQNAVARKGVERLDQ